MLDKKVKGIFHVALVYAAGSCSPHMSESTRLPVEEPREKPNIIFIMTDQHNADVMGFTGHPDARTPNLDRMAETGVVYSRAYCTDGISCASRMSVFTGYYPRTTGFLNNSNVSKSSTVLRQAVPIQQYLKSYGYETYAFGKRHLIGKADEGWDLKRSHLAAESPGDNYVMWIEEQGFADEFGKDWSAETGKYPNGNSLSGTVYERAAMGTRASSLSRDYTMEAYTGRNTIEMLRNYSEGDRDNPFFCFVSFYRPHQPYTPLPEYWSHYDRTSWDSGTGNGISMPATLRQDRSELPRFLRNLRNNENMPWCLGLASVNEQLYRDYISAYYALVEEVDYWIGEIFKVLEETGLADNTIVVYTSDHGDFVGAHGIIEKAAAGHNVYEETLRVPLIFWWKDVIPSGKTRGGLISLVDLYPTLVDLAGLPCPDLSQPLQGISYKDNILKGGAPMRDYVVSENWSQSAVITDEYKLGIWLDPPPAYDANDYRDCGNMLFNRITDREEVENLYNLSTYSSIVERLESYYRDFENNISDIGKKEVVKW